MSFGGVNVNKTFFSGGGGGGILLKSLFLRAGGALRALSAISLTEKCQEKLKSKKDA